MENYFSTYIVLVFVGGFSLVAAIITFVEDGWTPFGTIRNYLIIRMWGSGSIIMIALSIWGINLCQQVP